ncbi:hypothetical protein HPG69_002149 [Diceros bicornis minor]|uniref:Ig-like domain-containing protein n=1 Tax=Diceros bicornis minor TaxID=77932 RepID=A0A7J7FCD5_DICBM|nr:hypothetical protein HPG69_002149 [Diceros bicornis minor]
MHFFNKILQSLEKKEKKKCKAIRVSGQQLNQSPQSVSIQEGEDVYMNCNSSSTFNTSQWYKQDAGEGLVPLTNLYKAGELTRNGKLVAQFGGTRQDSFLNISASEPKDAGTYFCAGAQCSPGTCSLHSNLQVGPQPLCCLRILLLLA